MELAMSAELLKLGAVPSVHTTLRRPGMSALHFVLLVLCTQRGVWQTTATMSSDNTPDSNTDLPAYWTEDIPEAEDTPRLAWTPEASKFRMRLVFKHLATLNISNLEARARVNTRTALLGWAQGKLLIAILKWQVHATHKRGLDHIRSDHFDSLWQGDPATKAILSFRSKAAGDQRVLVLNWPEGKEVGNIISLSANYQVTASGKQDKRTKDIQVRFQTGERVQMPLKIFNTHPDSAELLADYKVAVKAGLANKNAQTRASLRRQLSSASRSKSLARLKNKNIKSSTSDEGGAAADRDTRAAARADLSQFLGESMGRKQSDSSSVSEPATSDGSDDEEDAVTEFNRDMQALEAAEARHVAAKTAKKKAKQQQKPRQVPANNTAASPQDLKSMAADAGADADFQDLLGSSHEQMQQDSNKAMLERMALFEQQVFDLRTALANSHNTDDAQPQYGLSVWEQTFRKKLDAVTFVNAEHYTIANFNKNTSCVNPDCDFIIPASAKFCSCGMPKTILGLACANPTCKMPCHGSLKQMCKQVVCYHCQSPMLFNLAARDRMEIMKEYTAQAALIKYDDAPPALLNGTVPKQFKIAEYENDIMIRHRLSNDPENEMIAKGARTMGEAWAVIYGASTHIPISNLFGVQLDFKVGAKLLLAVLKGIKVGRNLLAQLTDLLPVAGSLTHEQFMDWSKAAFEKKTPNIDWSTGTAPTLLTQYFEYFTQLLRCTAGSTVADDHEAGCLIMMAAHKAEGKRKIRWSAEMIFLKHAAWLAWYHSVCHAYVTESPYLRELYGGDVLWNHAHTDAQMPKLVCRYFEGGIAKWLPMFEGMFDEPARAALDQAALDLMKKTKQDKPKLGGNGDTDTDAEAVQTPSNLPAALSTRWSDAKQFYIKNNQADLESTYEMLWKNEKGKWVKIKLKICFNCLGEGHFTKDCTKKSHKSCNKCMNGKYKGTPSLNVMAFFQAVEEHGHKEADRTKHYLKRLDEIAKLHRERDAAEAAEGAPAEEANPAYPDMSGHLSTEEKEAAWKAGKAAPNKSLHNPDLEQMQVKCTVGPLTKYTDVQADSEAPIKATRAVNFSFPSALLEIMHDPAASGLDRGEMMRTTRGMESKRCALVQLFSIRKVSQASTFQALKNNSVYFLSNHTELSVNFGHLNHIDLVTSFLKQAHRAHSDIAARNQPSNLYWMKDSWLEELGTDAVAVWYVEGEQLSVNLFLLAVDQTTKSELNAPITHLLGFEGHAYQLVWEDGLETLGKTLTLLPKLFRYCDVGIDLCVRFKDTLEGKVPQVPDYLAANQSLKNLVRKLDGAPGPAMDGLQSDAITDDCTTVNTSTTAGSTLNTCSKAQTVAGITSMASITQNLWSWIQTAKDALQNLGTQLLHAMQQAEEQKQQLIDDTHQQLYLQGSQHQQQRHLGTLSEAQQPAQPDQNPNMSHCFQVERMLDSVVEPVMVRDCITGEECYEAVQILEERNPFESRAIENLTGQLLQWQISGEYTSDGFDCEVGTKLKELLELYNVTAWRTAITRQCRRAANWCLVSADWNTALNQVKRIKWSINRLHAVWAAPIRSSVCNQLSPTAYMLNMYAADIMRFISLDAQGRSTRIPHASQRHHSLLRDDSTASLTMSALLNATINQRTHLVKRVWRKIFGKAECEQQAAECFWALRKITNVGSVLGDMVQTAIRVWWSILDGKGVWTVQWKAEAMQTTELQDWLNDNLLELQKSAEICEHQDCLLPAQPYAVKAVTNSCSLQHALAQWPLWNNGELTTELLEDVQRYPEFDSILDQARAQTEMNTDPDFLSFKVQEQCIHCSNPVTLHSDDNDLVTDHCSDCWAESDLWRQLVVYFMHKESKHGIKLTTEGWSLQHAQHIEAATALCLCCDHAFNPTQCSQYPLQSTVYCNNCWHNQFSKCRSIKQNIIALQRWWRGIKHTVYHVAPATTPFKAKKQLLTLTSGDLSPTNWSPLTPQHYSQNSSFLNEVEASPIRAHQVNWSEPAQSRYMQARAQSVHRALPEDQHEWAQRQLDKFPKRKVRRSNRAKQCTDRWYPSSRTSSMDTSMSSSVSEGELQLALQDPGPAEVLAKAATKQTASTFAELQPQAGRTVMPVDVLPAEMRLKSSSEIHTEAKNRSRQSTIEFTRQLAITDSAPPEMQEQMQVAEVDDELQQAIKLSLDHFSKHTIEMDTQGEDSGEGTLNTTAAATQYCSTCKRTANLAEFPAGGKTCTKCMTAKRKRRHEKAVMLAEQKADDRHGKKLCSSKNWCPISDFTGGKKTCDTCNRLARAKNKVRKDVKYSVPEYAANNTSTQDFL